MFHGIFDQSAAAEEYTVCISAEELDPLPQRVSSSPVGWRVL